MDADAMRALVAVAAGRIRRAWLTVRKHLMEQNSITQIEARRSGIQSSVIQGTREAAKFFAAEQHAAYIASGQAMARSLLSDEPVQKKLIGFSATEAPAVAWAEANELAKIREITEDQRVTIRAIEIRAAREGTNPLQVAKEIRESIGLTASQEAMVDSYRRSLESGAYGSALERELSSGVSDRAISAALSHDTALSSAQIETAVERYRTNAIAMRAESIARTEGLRVAHQGSRETIRQAIERGDVNAEQIVRTWNHHPGAKGEYDREFHISMHGNTAGWDEPFVSGLGNELMFPCDPNAPAKEVIRCGCVVTTRIRPVVRKYDDAQPRSEDGKWTSGGGGAAERASASLKDSAFVAEHMNRLIAAGDEARAAFPREEQAMDVAHAAAQTAIHTEAMRIHAENDATAGPDQAELKATADQSRENSKWHGEDMASQHANVMANIARNKEDIAQAHTDAENVAQAIAAGHVSADVPHEAEDRFTAENDRVISEVSAIHSSLDEAHSVATDAIGKLEAMGTQSDDGYHDWSGKIDKLDGLYEAFDETSGQMSDAFGTDRNEAAHERSDAHEAVDFPTSPEHEEPSANDRPEEPEKPDPPEHDPEATPEENAAAHEEYQQELDDYHEADKEYQSELAAHDKKIAEHAAYEHAIIQHEAEFKARADAAQATLETLHEKQIAAAQKLQVLEKAHDAANEAAKSEVSDLPDDALVNHAAVAHDSEAQARAERASESMLSTERSNRNDERSLNFEESKFALKEEMRSTVGAIKQLSRVTGRAPRIPVKAKKPG